VQSHGSNGSAEEQALTRVAHTPTRSLLTAIGLTIVATLAVFAIERVFWYPAGQWSLFYPAVIACAWYGGRASGVVATLLSSALMWWYLVAPENERLRDGAGDDVVVAVVFIATGILISIGSHRYRRNTARLSRHYGYLQTILDYSPDAIALKDRNSRYLLVNEAFERIAGTTASVVVGRTPADVLPRALAEKVQASEKTVRATRTPAQFEMELADGRDVLITEFPLLNEANDLFAIGAIGTDISQRKAEERTLRETMEDLRTAQHVSHVGSWHWDFRANAAKWSDEMYVIFGVDRSRPPTPQFHPVERLLTADSLTRLRDAMGKLRVDGEPFEMDIEFTRPDGATRWCAARAEAARDEDGQIIGIHGTIADITHIKELERLRKEWTSIVAHDLRQPLGAITMATGILPSLQESDREERRVMLQRIQSSTQNLARMIDDLMDMSLLEANRLKLERSWADPEAATREAIERLRHAVGNPIRVEVSGSPARWCVDAMRIEQVLANLLSNAAKYGEPGAPIDVRLDRNPDGVEIGVTNSGGSINPEELPHLFDRFARSKMSRSSGVSGLGLGLYISKGIVEAHGGRIWADGVPGKRTTFHLSLPNAEARLKAA
jgi:PAS domain S-box-containing protein